MGKIIFDTNSAKGFKWHTINKVWVKGVFFDENQKLYSKTALPEYFKNTDSFDSFIFLLKKCNGIFSVIIKKNDEIWCAVDRNISSPLFYSKINNEWIVSDNTNTIAASLPIVKQNKFQVTVYRSLGHTFGRETLVTDINQVECAQALRLKDGKIVEKINYHVFSVKTFNNKPKKELLNIGFNLFEDSFNRLVKSLNGRTAVVPLSGGFDSRMIAAALKKLKYENVICFTYGKRENNNEIELSRKVAKALNYKWLFVEYNNKLFDGFLNTIEFHDYMHFSSHLSSMFYLQEYFAVRYLKNNKLVPEDSIFIPGHSGDLIGGSQLVKVIDKNLNVNNIVTFFINKKSIYNPLSSKNKKELKKLIQAEITDKLINKGATVFEELDIREKISKVIFNSSSVFDFFGYEKRFPFWDLKLLDFFLSLPPEHREMKKLYDSILIDKYFKPYGIYFKDELQPSKSKIVFEKIKNSIKQHIQYKFKFTLLKKRDWLNSYEAIMPLLNKMKENGHKMHFKAVSFNEILIEYYLFCLKKEISK